MSPIPAILRVSLRDLSRGAELTRALAGVIQ
jgi:hypothetical protein